jgi:hypothetical protein
VIWVFLREGWTERQLRTMVSDRTLPVLEDTPAADADQLYGLSSARICLIFGRDGCLLPTEGEIQPTVMDNPQQLLPYIERAAR